MKKNQTQKSVSFDLFSPPPVPPPRLNLPQNYDKKRITRNFELSNQEFEAPPSPSPRKKRRAIKFNGVCFRIFSW